MSIVCRIFQPIVVVLALCLLGCGKGQPSAPARSVEEKTPRDDAAAEAKPVSAVTNDEAVAFSKKWEQAVSSADVAAMERLFDWSGAIDRASSTLGLQEEIDHEQSFLSHMASSIAPDKRRGGTYRFVRVVDRDGEQHAVFRLLSSRQAPNYHDIRIVRDSERIVGDRFFVQLSGEEVADTMRTFYAPSILAQRSMVGGLSDEAKRKQDELLQFGRLASAVKSGKMHEALGIYESLSPSAKKQKLVKLYRILALDRTGPEDAIIAATADYELSFPGDPSLPAVCLGSAFRRNDFAKVKEFRNQIQAWVGGDPYFDVFVGWYLCKGGDTAGGVAMAKDVDPAPLGLMVGHYFRLKIDLVAKDFDGALKQLRVLRDTYETTLPLDTLAGHEAFMKSPQYASWLED